MIRLVSGPREWAEFMDICKGGAFGCKLRSVALAYGFERDFARFWTDGGASYCLLDGGLSIAGRPWNIEESREFLDVLGPGSVFCERGLAGELKLEVSTEGAVMAKDLPAGEPRSLPPPGLRETHALLTAAGMPMDFESFYLDMSHRIRHGIALALGEYISGELAGVAVISAVAGGEAVLSALAVREGCRGRGLGTKLMGAVERALPGHRLYLFRESGRKREFYKKLGFAEVGRWSQQDITER